MILEKARQSAGFFCESLSGVSMIDENDLILFFINSETLTPLEKTKKKKNIK
jgi:hypothetical protein